MSGFAGDAVERERFVQTNLVDIAEKYLGVEEFFGKKENSIILAMLQLDSSWVVEDEVPWCSAFVNWLCFNLGLERTKSLAARSWLFIGEPVLPYASAERGLDVVILKRGSDPQPPADVVYGEGRYPPGHVGVFAGWAPGNYVRLIAGNERNKVGYSYHPEGKILGIRRLRML